MARLVINDLPENFELDREAMSTVVGGSRAGGARGTGARGLRARPEARSERTLWAGLLDTKRQLSAR